MISPIGIKKVLEEYQRSRATHPPFQNRLHAYGVIREELDEFFDSVRSHTVDYSELAQVGATLAVAIIDLWFTGALWAAGSDFPERIKEIEAKIFSVGADNLLLEYSWVNKTVEGLAQHLTTDHSIYSICHLNLEKWIGNSDDTLLLGSLGCIYHYLGNVD